VDAGMAAASTGRGLRRTTSASRPVVSPSSNRPAWTT
jgi:hypothetical protein